MIERTSLEYNSIPRQQKIEFNAVVEGLSLLHYMAWVDAGRPGLKHLNPMTVRAFAHTRELAEQARARR